MLTPEEWVRQHLIHFMINDKGFPATLIAVERSLTVNGLTKRFDVCVFSNSGVPQLLIECKAPDIQIDDKVLMQISVYNHALGAPHVLVTNGIVHLYAKIGTNEPILIKHDIPAYATILG